MNERVTLVERLIKDRNSRILEIGPLNGPIISKKEFPNVFYCDIRSTEEIKKLYFSNDYLKATGIQINVDDIVDIDFVIKDSYKSTFSNIERFDYVVLSHVMEHMEDILGFFNDIRYVLKPGGKLGILYPDKRYCFDHFRTSATFADAYEVFVKGNKENARKVLDFFLNVIPENNPERYWNNDCLNKLLEKKDSTNIFDTYMKALQGEKIDDVHYWVFSDKSFLKFLYDCISMEAIEFSCVDFIPTQQNSQQFLIILQYFPQIRQYLHRELAHLQKLIFSLPDEFYNNADITNSNLLEEYKALLSEKDIELNKLKSEQEILESVLHEQKQNWEHQKGIFEEQISILNRDIINLIKANDYKDISIADKQLSLEKLNQQIIELRLIENSTIWRLTRPLRILIDFFKTTIRSFK